ncbi:putative CMGC/GSK protein kinase [Monocercomonoides exilis]|uniref:putative CMGC/GSK protein kinase n=1 Tax=Monocercomonoides exilis TaxID=2049356 RepID=UPI003559BB8C|nr:putative CMGC/GSK protein kinase [Monocercomonoides exilis]|eukprot:MONOS_490.1-p1 / transcript=MONOS_490.1 / gene=MONOS_490 / organism=Monocercomonoides_exilis_PA203 / gene_product=CMGC / transcript_product=CMGC / location=Mono_scaffold00008:7855-9068(-) / protein_length=335 / sequence_SO=supercontig / SO=protein_coding / is_pseudo=false
MQPQRSAVQQRTAQMTDALGQFSTSGSFHSQHPSSQISSFSVPPDAIPAGGSFGTVFQAKVAGTGEIVAVKRIRLERKFKNRELEILSILDHPNVCKLKHFFYSNGEGTEETYVNLVMEYVPFTLYGITRHLSRQHKSLPIYLVQKYCYQLLNALEYIHKLGICHRDVKLQNLLILPSTHTLKLGDFGSAKFLKKGETSVSYICSRFYRAPELVLGTSQYSFSIDMWSFGCILGELLIGHALFPGESTSGQLVEIVKFLGTPTFEEMKAMGIDPISDMPVIPKMDIKKMFREGTDPRALDLISRVLCYDPLQRLTAEEAKQHPFFDPVKSGLKVG